jgi:hypothetical protein
VVTQVLQDYLKLVVPQVQAVHQVQLVLLVQAEQLVLQAHHKPQELQVHLVLQDQVVQ